MGMGKFDRQGKSIDLFEWGRLLEQPGYKIVKQEALPNGYWVSTVWIGLDHQFGDGPATHLRNNGFHSRRIE